jgi:hypothetical protein
MNVTGVWLRRSGGETDPMANAIVAIEVDGKWHDIIVEHVHGNFSHIAEVDNMNLAEYPHALDKAEHAFTPGNTRSDRGERLCVYELPPVDDSDFALCNRPEREHAHAPVRT